MPLMATGAKRARTDSDVMTCKLHDLCATGIVVHTGVQFVLANDAHEAAFLIQRAWRLFRKRNDWKAWAEDMYDGNWLC